METKQAKINLERLKKHFEQISAIGYTENTGVTRLALSKEDQQARELLIDWMRALGLRTRFDDVGNIYGRLEGVNKHAPAVLIGSHIDSVPNGGKFDGTLGVIAGLEVVATIIDQNIKPTYPIEIVAFTNEEGARFTPQMLGSGVITEEFSRDFVYQRTDLNGYNFKAELENIGFLGNESDRVKNIKAFLELHIEQGPVLEHENLPIGIVEGIAGFSWMEVTIHGESNHSGTTPMNMRKDALITAASLITELHQFAEEKQDGTVLTIGRIQTRPNIVNAVTEQAVFSIDVRNADREKLTETLNVIKKMIEDTLTNLKMLYEIDVIWSKNPVHFSPSVIDLIEKNCKVQDIPYKKMISGAGHDAMYMSNITDTAMIFVPSIAGKSHCKEENTSWHDIEKGVEILFETVCDLSK